MKLLIATKNENKFREMRHKLSGFDFELVSLDDFKNVPDVEEDRETFKDNAIKKAQFYASKYEMLALADDSGLEIDYLAGMPGVRSKRFASTDRDRINKVLRLMKSAQSDNRNSTFICAISISDPKGKTFDTIGTCKGIIAEKPKGTNGFGYDPIFYLPELQKTMAELSLKEKNRISHRAKAIENVVGFFSKEGLKYFQ